jgi:hypothetical protein
MVTRKTLSGFGYYNVVQLVLHDSCFDNLQSLPFLGVPMKLYKIGQPWLLGATY